jgi:hypothetical protein
VIEGGGPDARHAAPAAAAEPEPAESEAGLRTHGRRRHRLPRAAQPPRAHPAQLRQHQRPPARRAWHHLQRSQVLHALSIFRRDVAAMSAPRPVNVLYTAKGSLNPCPVRAMLVNNAKF